MTVEELAPGLWYWLAPHPEWTPEENWPELVPGVYWEAPDAVVLFDPLAPRGEEEAFWRALDRDVERLGLPVRVLLTAPWHERGTADFVARYGASVWAPPQARWKGASPTTTGELPEDVEAILAGGEDHDQALFFIRAHGTLVAGDVFSATGGRFHLFCDDEDESAFRRSLAPLLTLPIDRVVIAHGERVVYPGAEVAAALV